MGEGEAFQVFGANRAVNRHTGQDLWQHAPHELVDPSFFSPLFGRQEHLLGFGDIELARAQEPMQSDPASRKTKTGGSLGVEIDGLEG